MIGRDPTAATLAAVAVIALGLALVVIIGRRVDVALAGVVAVLLRAGRGIQVLQTGDFSDGIQYDAFAVALARYWEGLGADPGSWVGKDGFPAVLAALYRVFGHAPEVGYAVNAVAGGLTVVVIGSVMSHMGWLDARPYAAWLVALWPVGVIWGGMLLRESLVTLLLAIALWGSVRLYMRRVPSGFAAIAVAGLLMVFMRGGLAFLVLVGMPLVAAIASAMRGRFGVRWWAVSAVSLVLAIVALSWLSEYFADSLFFQYRSEVTNAQNVGTSSFAEAGLGGVTLTDSLTGHVVRLPLTFFGPFPWQVRNLALAQAFVDAALWIAAWTLAAFGASKLQRKADALLFLLPPVAVIAAVAASAANFGLIMRLRGQAFVLLAPLVAVGLVHAVEAMRRRSRAKRPNRQSAGAGLRVQRPAAATARRVD